MSPKYLIQVFQKQSVRSQTQISVKFNPKPSKQIQKCNLDTWEKFSPLFGQTQANPDGQLPWEPATTSSSSLCSFVFYFLQFFSSSSFLSFLSQFSLFQGAQNKDSERISWHSIKAQQGLWICAIEILFEVGDLLKLIYINVSFKILLI